LEQIEDTDLRNLAYNSVTQCLQKLREYNNGVIDSEEDGVKYATERMKRCQNSYQATFWAPIAQIVYDTDESASWQNFYEANVDASCNRNVNIERIFLLSRNSLIDKSGNFLDSRILELMQRQKSDKIKVRVLWLEELSTSTADNKLYQDFGIFDGHEVITQERVMGNLSHGMVIHKHLSEVEDYQKRFQKLHNLSRPLDDVLKKHPPVPSVPAVSEPAARS
jgi:hypothetical protein